MQLNTLNTMKLKGVIHKMKYFTIALMLIAIISTPAISDLSQDDLNKIRLLIADELKQYKRKYKP